MLSGNGRHRRPRQAPALLVAAGVTGSAIAIPLLAASGASAASGTTWDQVASCESGGSWSAHTSDGHYGGLHLTKQDWNRYGGLDYAPTPDQASRSQQIAVAEKILADRGASAWPGCGQAAGLAHDSGSADVVTGLADDLTGGSHSDDPGTDPGMDSGLSDSSGTTDSSGSSGSSSPSAASTPSTGTSSPAPSSSTTPDADGTRAGSDAPRSPAGSPTPTAKRDDSGKSGRSDPSSHAGDDTTPGAGRHRGGSAEDGRTDDASGRHASRGADDARGAADGTYTVRPGDSLSAIADSLDLKGGWAVLYEANKGAVGADPDLIFPGQSLALDARPAADPS
ncbi:transglycosylase family protein [Streptomyces sp. NPDC048664]|uniref:transglycosylase family protein n=1 Tax=Streptomyces sp. NPDC048664 TaxID=3154505 RepID=UPI00343BC00B